MALDDVTSHFSTMLEPIASASFLSSLSIIHDVKEIHDDAHLRLKRASPSIARGRFNFSGENADRQN